MQNDKKHTTTKEINSCEEWFIIEIQTKFPPSLLKAEYSVRPTFQWIDIVKGKDARRELELTKMNESGERRRQYKTISAPMGT